MCFTVSVLITDLSVGVTYTNTTVVPLWRIQQFTEIPAKHLLIYISYK